MITNTTHSNGLISPSRKIDLRVTLMKAGTTTIIDTYTNTNYIKKMSISRTGDKKFFGFGVCQEMELKLTDKERAINISKGQSLQPRFCIDSAVANTAPRFTITDVARDENTNEITIKAYDVLHLAKSKTVSELNMPVNYSMSALVVKIATALGTSYASKLNTQATTVFSRTNRPGANFDGSETLRQALDMIAEATQSIYYINQQNVLIFKSIDITNAPVLTINKSDYFTLENKGNRILSDICSATELGDNHKVSKTDVVGETQYVRDNAFWEINSGIVDLLQKAISNIGGMEINQFDIKWRGNYLLEPGDRIGIITKDNQRITSYVFNDKFDYDGGLVSTMSWEFPDNGESMDNPVTIGDALKKTYAKVDKTNQQIEIVAGEVSEIKLDNESIKASVTQLSTDVGADIEEVNKLIGQVDEDLNKSISDVDARVSELTLTADGISATVAQLDTSVEDGFAQIDSDLSAIQTTNNDAVNKLDNEISMVKKEVNAKMSADDVNISIQAAITQGINSITTTTGFTFNQTGLHISKSDSEINTSITEDGMSVKRRGEEVLVADNLGVKAEDLHATTFLIIGQNSRFEDYKGNRTGCFYIGNL